MKSMDYPRALSRFGWLKPVEPPVDHEHERIPEDLDRPEQLRIGVHDTSRVECTVTLPLERRRYEFEIEFMVEVPANLISISDLWTHFQELARLHSPDTEVWAHASGNDDLRRATLAVTHRLKMLQDRHGRSCMVANSLLLQEARRDISTELEPIIDEGVTLVRQSRERLAALATSGASPAESRLADEFLSTKLLDFLSELERDLQGTLLSANARFREQYVVPCTRLRDRVAAELSAELRRRADKGFLNPSGESTEELEDYLERASHLKKHFQEVLFLELSTEAVEGKLKNVVAILAAIIAALFYFLAMIGPTIFAPGAISIGTTALIGAFVYAVKDRIKEVFRGWLNKRILRLYGTRRVFLRVPARLVRAQPSLVSSRDVFTVTYENRRDALNPEIGATRRFAVLHYRKRGVVEQSPATAKELERKGLRSIKQIFRFDLSPVFPRLDDPLKRIPVLTRDAQTVRWVDAPRTYHFPVTSRIVTPDGTTTATGEIVALKNGIARLDLEDCTTDPTQRTRGR